MDNNNHYSLLKEFIRWVLYLGFMLVFTFSLQLRASELEKFPLNVQLTSEEKSYLILKKKLTHCGDPAWMPYSSNSNGVHAGITADYIAMFSGTLEIPFEYIPTSSWKETLEKAKTRECDLISALVDKPDRREYLDFTKGYLNTTLALATLTSAPNINNPKALDGKRIGVVKGYASTTYIRNSFPNLELVEIDNLQQGMKRVYSQELYGVAGTLGVLAYMIQNHYFDELKVNGNFAGNWNQSIGTRNDEPLLNSIMDKVIDAIPEQAHRQIFSNWLSDSVLIYDPNELSLKEMQFILEHPVIRFHIRPDRAPFEYEKDGEAHGMSVDYIKHIANIYGFTAEFFIKELPPAVVLEEMEKPKSERELDTMAIWVENESRKERVHFGDVYLSYPMVIVSDKRSLYINSLSDLNSRQVAVEKGFLTNKWLARDYPEISIVNVSSTRQALDLVENGQVVAYVGNLAVTNYLIASGEMNNIMVAAPTEYGNINYRFVAPKAWPELASILSKGYKSIPPSEHTSIMEKWFTLQKIEKTDYTLLLVVLLFSAMLLAASFSWNTRLSKEKKHTEEALDMLRNTQNDLEQKNAELQILSTTDALTGLHNRVKLESILDAELQYATRYDDHQFGIIMIDIDRFKSINDTFGHQVGDTALKASSSLFQENVRSVDSIGRWGGEEFLIVCPHTDQKGLFEVAEHLRKLLAQHDFSEIKQITASFGVTTYSKGDTSESLVSRADIALYQSKKNGRNLVTQI